jgi:polyisoprenoid-binding protein YceI
MIAMLALMTLGATALLAPSAAALPANDAVCAQTNTFVFGVVHTCVGNQNPPFVPGCFVNFYDNTLGERTGFLVEYC